MQLQLPAPPTRRRDTSAQRVHFRARQAVPRVSANWGSWCPSFPNRRGLSTCQQITRLSSLSAGRRSCGPGHGITRAGIVTTRAGSRCWIGITVDATASVNLTASAARTTRGPPLARHRSAGTTRFQDLDLGPRSHRRGPGPDHTFLTWGLGPNATRGASRDEEAAFGARRRSGALFVD